jgi:hypothetical protein
MFHGIPAAGSEVIRKDTHNTNSPIFPYKIGQMGQPKNIKIYVRNISDMRSCTSSTCSEKNASKKRNKTKILIAHSYER